jgi:hypothetical protein
VSNSDVSYLCILDSSLTLSEFSGIQMLTLGGRIYLDFLVSDTCIFIHPNWHWCCDCGSYSFWSGFLSSSFNCRPDDVINHVRPQHRFRTISHIHCSSRISKLENYCFLSMGRWTFVFRVLLIHIVFLSTPHIHGVSLSLFSVMRLTLCLLPSTLSAVG